MPNLLLSPRTETEIDQRVEKILADLGNPPPPLDLEQVRSLLKLDLRYYSSTDSSAVAEMVHQLRIGTKQVLARPSRILDVIRERSLKALWVPDRRRILIDEALADTKKRWGEGHEIIHSVIPHHQILTLGDPEYTLKPACHEQLEAEANYGAGRLLFLRDEFRERLLSSTISFQSVRDLAKEFGNSQTSTLWRVVETLDAPAVGLVSIHPWEKRDGHAEPVRHFVRSRPFAKQFANIDELELLRILAKVVRRRGGGPIGEDEAVMMDVDGAEHVFRFECFGNTYDTLTLGMCCGAKSTSVAV